MFWTRVEGSIDGPRYPAVAAWPAKGATASMPMEVKSSATAICSTGRSWFEAGSARKTDSTPVSPLVRAMLDLPVPLRSAVTMLPAGANSSYAPTS